jgi:hypothetical protein
MMISKGKPKKSEKNPHQYHFCHHRSHMTSHKTETTVPQQEGLGKKYGIEILCLYLYDD